jgi:hypothetical protein
MVDIFRLTCPSCGGKLLVSKDLDRFACEYCGNEHVVKRNGGAVSLAPVMDTLAKIKAKVDKTASELAIGRLREEIAALDEKLNDINYANEATVGVAMLGIGGIATFIGMSTGYGIVLLGLLCLIIGAGVLSRGMRVTTEERKLEQVLKKKKTELEHHERILKQ